MDFKKERDIFERTASFLKRIGLFVKVQKGELEKLHIIEIVANSTTVHY